MFTPFTILAKYYLPVIGALYLHGGLVNNSILLLSGLLCSYLSILVAGYFSLYIELPITQSIIESTSISPTVVVYSGQLLTSVCSILIVLVAAIKVLNKLKVIPNKVTGVIFISVFFIGLCSSIFYYDKQPVRLSG